MASVLTPPSPLPSYTDSPSFSQLTLRSVLNKEKKNEVISKKKMLKSNIKLWISICISWDFCSNPLIHLFFGYLYQFLGILSIFEKGFSHRFSCQMNKSDVICGRWTLPLTFGTSDFKFYWCMSVVCLQSLKFITEAVIWTVLPVGPAGQNRTRPEEKTSGEYSGFKFHYFVVFFFY